jgi:YidC/Oxa1 family membrane protein insertase
VDKRLIAFFVISAVIMVGWNFLIPKPKTPPAPIHEPVKPVVVDPPSAFFGRLQEFLAKGMHEKLRTQASLRDDIVLTSKYLRATFTNAGAAVKSLELLGYPKEGDVTLLLETLPDSGPSFVLADPAKVEPIGTAPWSVVDPVTADSVAFEYEMRNGLRIRKRFTMDTDRHTISLQVDLNNASGEKSAGANLDWHVIRRLPNDSVYRADQYLMGYHSKQGGDPEFTAFSQVLKAPVALAEPNRDLYGVRNRYFTVAIIPLDTDRIESGWRLEALPSKDPVGNPSMQLILPVTATVEKERSYRFTVFGGPLVEHVLEEGGRDRLEKLSKIGGGCFLFAWVVPPITKLLVWLMTVIASLVGNYGVAIILTTLAVRLALFPLSRKSQISMAKYTEMQKKLKPKMDALQKRHADAPDKMRQAQMELFREHGMSLFPVAGCLPMVLQLPVFIGMYSVFDQSIALRKQPFFGWINDLSQSDHLAHISGPMSLWFISFDGYLNLLPILMTITWFLQSYFQPKSPDPQMAAQQRMMLFMPVFFGLMCYTLASGLSLYFLVNSLLGLAEQKLIKRLWLPKPDAAAGAVVVAPDKY